MNKKLLLGLIFSILLIFCFNEVQAVEEGNNEIQASSQEQVGQDETEDDDETEEQTEQEEGDWTDFSGAKYELVKDGSDVKLKTSGVTLKDHSYYVLILNNAQKPEIPIDDIEEFHTDEGDLVGYLFYEDDKHVNNITRKAELNQDLYVAIIETCNVNHKLVYKVVSYGTKLTRPQEPQYTDAFRNTLMCYDSYQIVTWLTHYRTAIDGNGHERKMKIKVGKITDKSILQKIKNEDNTGFANLMNFARSNSGIYENIVNVQKSELGISNSDTNFDGKKLLNDFEDEEYYYLYVKSDDENGKYISNDAVTFAQANVYDDSWYMFFYGSSDFKWADFGNVTEDEGKTSGSITPTSNQQNNNNPAPQQTGDNTTAPTILPNTGVGKVIFVAISVMIISVIVAVIQYRRYNF